MRRAVVFALVASCICSVALSQVVDAGVVFNTNVAGDVQNTNADAVCKTLTISADKTKCTGPTTSCVTCKTCVKGAAFWMSDSSANALYASATVAEKKTWTKYCKSSMVALLGSGLAAMLIILA